MTQKTYTVKQVAEALGFSTNTVYKYLGEGKIKATRLGTEGRFRIPESEVVRLLGLRGERLPVENPVEIREAVREEKGEEILRSLSTPSLFDWFISMIAIFLGLSYFLFPYYLQDISIAQYISLITIVKILLIVLGGTLLVADVFRLKHRLWHTLLHLALGALFAVLTYVFFATGNYLTMLGNAVVSFLLLTTAFLRLSDFVRFVLLVSLFALGSGFLFLLNPQNFPSKAFAEWIDANKTVFILGWYGLFLLVIAGILYGAKRHDTRITFVSFAILGAGAFFYATLNVSEGFWDRAVYAMLVAAFMLLAPFWRKFEFFTHASKKESLEGFSYFLTIFVIGLGLVFYLQQSFKNYVFSQTSKSLKVAEEIVKSHIRESQRAVESFAKEEKLVEEMSSSKKNITSLDRLAKNFYLNSTTLRRIILIDKEGKGLTVYPADETFQSIDLTGRNYFQEAKANKRTAISEVIKPVIPGVPAAVVIAAPILGEKGEFLGALAGSVDFVKLANKLNEVKFGSGGIFVIADQTKHIIYHPNPQMLLQPITNNKALSLALEGKEGQMEGYSNEGKLQLQSFMPIKTLGWGIVAQQPLALVLQNQSPVSFVIFLVTMLSGVISLLAIVYLRRK